MVVEKLAAEAGIPLLCISPSAILSKWSGESEKTLRWVERALCCCSHKRGRLGAANQPARTPSSRSPSRGACVQGSV